MSTLGCHRAPEPQTAPRPAAVDPEARARSAAEALSHPPSRASALGRQATPASGKAGRTTTNYKLTGKVVSVDPKRRVVNLRHDAIPGFMDAMTMPFTLRDPAIFEDLRPNDEVEGNLRVEKENGEVADYELSELVVARPAPPPQFKLGIGGDGQATLTPVPQRLRPGDTVPDFAMTTQEGKPLRLSDLKGKYVVLTFIYTRCPLPNFCPAMDKKFSQLADRIEAVAGRADQIRLLSVSFDPEHDTPEILAQHARTRGARLPLWVFAVATHPELAKIAAPLGLTYGPTANEVIHNLSTAVIDPEGRLIRLETDEGARSLSPTDVLKLIHPRIQQTKG
ncbi:MAG: SCO family protein [Isosphaeraceae bacterium]